MNARETQDVLALADAADSVGVAYFDSDDLSPEASALQSATLRVRLCVAQSPNCDADPLIEMRGALNMAAAALATIANELRRDNPTTGTLR